jgi:hypothetical protein
MQTFSKGVPLTRSKSNCDDHCRASLWSGLLRLVSIDTSLFRHRRSNTRFLGGWGRREVVGCDLARDFDFVDRLRIDYMAW